MRIRADPLPQHINRVRFLQQQPLYKVSVLNNDDIN